MHGNFWELLAETTAGVPATHPHVASPRALGSPQLDGWSVTANILERPRGSYVTLYDIICAVFYLLEQS